MKSLSEFLEVPEGVEFFIADWSERYKISNNKLVVKSHDDDGFCWKQSTVKLNTIIEFGIAIPKQYTECEKVIARCIEDKYKWIARDSDQEINVFLLKPTKGSHAWYGEDNTDNEYGVTLPFTNMFQSVKSTDTEPTLIADIYK